MKCFGGPSLDRKISTGLSFFLLGQYHLLWKVHEKVTGTFPVKSDIPVLNN